VESTLSSEAVTWAYRLFLEREPEDYAVIADKLSRLTKISELRQEFLHSNEFRQNNPGIHAPALAGNEPPMSIQEVESDAELEVLFQHIQEVWQHLGETEPYWSVLTAEPFKLANIQKGKSLFYESGKWDVICLFQTLERNGIDSTPFRSCLDYGCGLGRVVRWLSEKFERVYGYDISRSHLLGAEAYLNREGVGHVTLRHVREVRDVQDLPRVDLIHSVKVLQHNPPPLMSLIIRAFIRALNSGGVAFFQLPTYRLNYAFSLAGYLNDEATRLDMEMHVLPQSRVFEIVTEEGGLPIEVLEDDQTGLRQREVSNTFLVQKM
jgi:2-polyprenyl-3-methyl-5-hydroxy-6-metoxy-1,4-benzoquinol methylase